ncbi:hypothetical protein MAR_016259 [Mya arenaria]|uniref:Uncharacterized protein n=1 Tax=Mya arenaria TaxID=6604 RepID=A0ABY7FJB6_MYAAR|nr:hypothetical protein MAR_016259 [Mya arenaria]
MPDNISSLPSNSGNSAPRGVARPNLPSSKQYCCLTPLPVPSISTGTIKLVGVLFAAVTPIWITPDYFHEWSSC